MQLWHEALRTFRRRSLAGDRQEKSEVMVIICSEHHPAAALFSACQPAAVLQLHGGIRDASDGAVRGAIEYAVRLKGVRSIVVGSHVGCTAISAEAGVDERAAAQANVVAQCRRLRQDAHIGALLREYSVVLRAVWFDDDEGDVYGCDIEGRTSRLLSDQDFARLIAKSIETAP